MMLLARGLDPYREVCESKNLEGDSNLPDSSAVPALGLLKNFARVWGRKVTVLSRAN